MAVKKKGCFWKQSSKNKWRLICKDKDKEYYDFVSIEMHGGGKKDSTVGLELYMAGSGEEICKKPRERVMKNLKLSKHEEIFDYSVLNNPKNREDVKKNLEDWKKKILKVIK